MIFGRRDWGLEVRGWQLRSRADSPSPQLLTPNPQSGFTLTELLVVLGIIGILAGLVVASVATARAKARDNTRQTDLATVATALELYRSQFKSYPVVSPTSSDTWRDLQIALAPYLPNWPTDPSGDGDGDGDGQFAHGYFYAVNARNPADSASHSGERFFLDVALERESALTAPDLTGCQLNFDDSCAFQTGTYRSLTDGKIHYRLAR